MKTVIHKQQLLVATEQEIVMPAYSELLCVKVQRGVPCLWYSCPPRSIEDKSVTIFTYGTGEEYYDIDGLIYIDSYFLDDGDYVFHVFY
jgi:hypothetical protein